MRRTLIAIAVILFSCTLYAEETTRQPENADDLETLWSAKLPELQRAWESAARNVLTAPEGVRMEFGKTFQLRNEAAQRELADAFGFQTFLAALVPSNCELGVNPGPCFVSASENVILFFQFAPWDSPDRALGILIFRFPERKEMLILEGNFSRDFCEKVAAWYPKMESVPSAENSSENEMSGESEFPFQRVPEAVPSDTESEPEWSSFFAKSLRDSEKVTLQIGVMGPPALNLSEAVSGEIRQKLADGADFQLTELESEPSLTAYSGLIWSGNQCECQLFAEDSIAVVGDIRGIHYFQIEADTEFRRILRRELRAALEKRLNTILDGLSAPSYGN